MAATAAATLPSREDPRAALRIAQNNERRARQERATTTRSFGDLPTLNASLGQTVDAPSPANNNAYLRQAQQKERLRRQVGAAIPLYPAPESLGDEASYNEFNDYNYQQAAQNTYALSQLGLDSRATSAIRGEINSVAEKAVDQAIQAGMQKAQEVAQRWLISIFKNGLSVTEIPPWAAYMIQALTYLYDCARAVVTIFVPDPGTIDMSNPSGLAGNITKKTIRGIIPPFSLMEPIGLLGFIFQSLVVVALITVVIFLLLLIPALGFGLGQGIGYFFFGG